MQEKVWGKNVFQSDLFPAGEEPMRLSTTPIGYLLRARCSLQPVCFPPCSCNPGRGPVVAAPLQTSSSGVDAFRSKNPTGCRKDVDEPDSMHGGEHEEFKQGTNEGASGSCHESN
eukprot:gnl/TRDRNA2_/TRDRNA2_214401_c0_seq1.p2 gnl/TRDRNA2_/TRDRNA2_214401_c0~~gnl/TRDRNA2_/TRDRNA2_214401_c0_seq1.p2  ORF type:complete len:115 (+),score=0.37 gnl/TRDRNA2_/TRDRNA2_214401_c0_seq1:177-521(+)